MTTKDSRQLTMSRLERRYRRLLRLLPGYYRAAWAEDMVATFLATMLPEDADDRSITEEYGSPSFAEVRSVLALAVRLRLGFAGDAPRRYQIAGAATRLIALLGLLFMAAHTVALALNWIFVAQLYPGSVPGPFLLLNLLWVPAFCCVVLGRRAVGAVFAVLAWGSTVVELFEIGQMGAGLLSGKLSELFVQGLIVAALVALHPGAPPVRPRPWLLAGLGVALLFAGSISLGLVAQLLLVVAPTDPAGILLVLCGLTFLLLPRLPWRQRPQAWASALAVLALMQGGVLLVAAATWTTDLAWIMVAQLVQAGVLLALTASLALFARHTSRGVAPQHDAGHHAPDPEQRLQHRPEQ